VPPGLRLDADTLLEDAALYPPPGIRERLRVDAAA
jgi:hypothetical protein